MNEPDVINNRYQLHLAMKEAERLLPGIIAEYEPLSGRHYAMMEGYRYEDAEVLFVLLGSAYLTAQEAVDKLREDNISAGVITFIALRPFPKTMINFFPSARTIIILDRQDSYGADGGNLSLEVNDHLYRKINARVVTRIYGLGGKDLFVEDILSIAKEAMQPQSPCFAYHGITEGTTYVAGDTSTQNSSLEKKVPTTMAGTPAQQPP